ncbi:unnamed protein product [Rotaria sp. Silwood2]|nr:unnamed protein product [Rotaria sp. Silwood2]CAF2764493.1 unnamed protein product [Rotaria sp. Silwood2]CAF3160219.1 unnamed protein product [Rotaria sp. Silwood2]CAF3290828.1 unnamed protein product [Rotaria sp. Silwood2]CAF4024292.1 unnamed protein product [Rotaria sp. Silwood2]
MTFLLCPSHPFPLGALVSVRAVLHLSLFLAKCCGTGILRFCCPSKSTCSSYPICDNYYYWGSLTLAGLIGVIAASIIGCILLIALCSCLCKRRQRTTERHITFLPQSFHNPVVHQAPPPYTYSTKA